MLQKTAGRSMVREYSGALLFLGLVILLVTIPPPPVRGGFHTGAYPRYTERESLSIHSPRDYHLSRPSSDVDLGASSRYDLFYRDGESNREFHSYSFSLTGSTRLTDRVDFMVRRTRDVFQGSWSDDAESYDMEFQRDSWIPGVRFNGPLNMRLATSISLPRGRDQDPGFNAGGSVKLFDVLTPWYLQLESPRAFNVDAELNDRTMRFSDHFVLERTMYGIDISRPDGSNWFPEGEIYFSEDKIRDYRGNSPPGESHDQFGEGTNEYSGGRLELPSIEPVRLYTRYFQGETWSRFRIERGNGDRMATVYNESETDRYEGGLNVYPRENLKVTVGYFQKDHEGIGSGIFEPSNFNNFLNELLEANGSGFYEFDSESHGGIITVESANPTWGVNAQAKYISYKTMDIRGKTFQTAFGIPIESGDFSESYDDLDLANIGVDVTYQSSDRYQLHLGIEQLIPLNVEEDDNGGASGGGTVGGGGGGSSDNIFDRWGGLTVESSVRVQF